jgi:hypothetical protein
MDPKKKSTRRRKSQREQLIPQATPIPKQT